MMYLGIDQHARQLTISLRDESGDVIQARQVSTRPEKVQDFFAALTQECAARGEKFIAVVEVCGFNDWSLKMLQDYRCERVILPQPEERQKQKTDRRDASALSELLWVNRARFLAGKPVRGLRQVELGNTSNQEDRRLTTLRQEGLIAKQWGQVAKGGQADSAAFVSSQFMTTEEFQNVCDDVLSCSGFEGLRRCRLL